MSVKVRLSACRVSHHPFNVSPAASTPSRRYGQDRRRRPPRDQRGLSKNLISYCARRKVVAGRCPSSSAADGSLSGGCAAASHGTATRTSHASQKNCLSRSDDARSASSADGHSSRPPTRTLMPCAFMWIRFSCSIVISTYAVRQRCCASLHTWNFKRGALTYVPV